MRRTGVTIVAALLAAAVPVAAWAVTRGDDDRSPVAAAVASIPAGSGTVDVTVWRDLPASVEDAVFAGQTNRSVIAGLADELDQALGWDPTELAWEAYARALDGQVVVLSLGSLDAGAVDRAFDAVADRDDGVWQLTADAAVSNDFSSTFAFAQVLPERGLLVAANTREAVEATVSTAQGRAPSLLAERSVATLVERTRGLSSVMLQARPAWCAPQLPLDDTDLQALRSAEQRFGSLQDPVWGLRGIDGGDAIVFAAAFETPDLARAQAAVREALTEGRFLGRFGDVDDALRDRRAYVDGGVVGFTFRLTEDAEDFMVGAGPVLFSGCGVPSPA